MINLKKKLIYVLLIFILGGCAHKKPALKHQPFQKPISPNRAASPEMNAALELVRNGVEAIKRMAYSQAEWFLEQAIQISPSLGEAYLWLADVKLKMKQPGLAKNFLDRAEVLLQNNPSWRGVLLKLRRMIEENQK